MQTARRPRRQRRAWLPSVLAILGLLLQTLPAIAQDTTYLPVTAGGSGPLVPPAISFISPSNNQTVSGTLYVAVQAVDPAAVTSVNFKAGETDLGTDSNGADGYAVIVSAADLPAGPLQISALATGPAGQDSATINVTVASNPPSSTQLGANGGAVASQIGSIITFPPGAAPEGAQVDVTERTQAETTTEHGIDWDSMGVTFLGAQDVTVNAAVERPLQVSSAGFGNRVQPGQVVVNYRIMPDADGDGINEIVVVNTATVAPNNDVISDPVNGIAVRTISEVGGAQVALAARSAATVGGQPGAVLKARADGLNPVGVYSNRAIWRSGDTELEGNIMVLPGGDGITDLATLVIPALPAGEATVQLYNTSTGSLSEPIPVTVEGATPLVKPAGEILDGFFADTVTYLQNVPSSTPEQAADLQRAADQFNSVRQQIADLVAAGPTPAEQAALDQVALTIQNSDYYNVDLAVQAAGYADPDDAYSDFLGFLGGIVGILGGAATVAGATAALPAIAGGAAIGLGILATLYFGCKLLGGGDCLGEYPSPEPNCGAAPSNSGGGTTGMGAAPPPGGNGCGSAGGGGDSSLVRAAGISAETSQRYMVKINSNATPLAFTGMTDPGGYFFIPLIPEGEPFTALAIDTLSGATRRLSGVGPATGESVVLFFDFLNDDGSGAESIQVGDIISGTWSAGDTPLLYSFQGTAGQQVFFDTQLNDGLNQLSIEVTTLTGEFLVNSCLGCGDSGLRTLPATGTYLLTLGARGGNTDGSYRLKLWDVPAPDQFNINTGDTVADGAPGPGAGNIETPGAKDIYNFSAAAGQQVYFDFQGQEGISLIGFQVTDSTGATIADNCLGCGEPGVRTLEAGGLYTVTVGAARNDGVGTYGFQIWDVPAPDEFNIAVGDAVADSVPGPGAGNIESPGVKDIYRFNAAAGQSVYFDFQGQTGVSLVSFQVTDSTGATIADNCLGCGEPGLRVLEAGGLYTVTVGSNTNDGIGTYGFQLWDVPAPDEFNIAVGDTVADGVPGPGAGNIESPAVKDIYRFSATAGQRVFFDLQGQTGLSLVEFDLTDSTGETLVNNCLGCGEIGALTLAAGGAYTITVGDDNDDAVGTYGFQLWSVPADDEFDIAIGDTVSDGAPAAGAGNIESPGARDIYRFNATAGQEVEIDFLAQTGLSLVEFTLTDSEGGEVLSRCLGCGDPGRVTLPLGGVYTITVGDDVDDAVGTYSFALNP